jgi:adenosylmethionine-8-amino-7-oxononanoate aminotransferase
MRPPLAVEEAQADAPHTPIRPSTPAGEPPAAPFTQMQGLKPCRGARGALVGKFGGNEHIDAFASPWTVNVGTTQRSTTRSGEMKALHLPHLPYHNEPAYQAAAKVANAPATSSRSSRWAGESVETAVKMARQYWRTTEVGTIVVMFRRAYHAP